MRNLFTTTFFAGVSLALTAGIVAASASPAAAAVPTGDTPHAIVRYADLNLADATARAELDGRIRAAAAMVCPITEGVVDFAAMQCRATAIQQARRDIAERTAPRTAVPTQHAAP
ncbi:UrcA family protein [uncultured Sphingomonas sp.]|uniref:UrcA family protein n=1 Tax=uncultured Sphingomonas sp. TaxID=158754 RepID=UPI002608046B|nr:UrcA family protein [uncultured Sphingomonas sp.]